LKLFKRQLIIISAAFFFVFTFNVAQSKFLFLEQTLIWALIPATAFLFKSNFFKKFKRTIVLTVGTTLFIYGLFQKFLIFPTVLQSLSSKTANNFFAQALKTRLESGRIFGPFPLPTIYAFVCSFFILIICNELLKSRQKLLLIITLILAIGNLILTQTFAAVLYTAIALSYLLVKQKKLKLKTLFPFLSAILLLLSLFIALRFSEARQLAPIRLRLQNWTQAIRVINSFPLSGTGWGNYQATVPAFTYQHEAASIYAHNFFLQFAAESGLPLSLLLFSLLCLIILKNRQTLFDIKNSLAISLLLLLFFYNLIDIGNYNSVASICLGYTLALLSNTQNNFNSAESINRIKTINTRFKIVFSTLVFLLFLFSQIAKNFQLKGNLFLAESDLSSASQNFQLSLLFNPWQYYSLTGLAEINFRFQNLEEALKYLQRAKTINPGYGYLNFLHSQICLKQGKLIAALYQAYLAAKKNPTNENYQKYYANLSNQAMAILSATD